MSEDLFYNRDENISGVAVTPELSGMSQFSPTYGSKVEFKGINNSYITDDFNFNLIPLSVDSLRAKFDVLYTLNESGAQNLATFFESKSGYLPLEFTPDRDLTGNLGIYKTISGYCDNYGIKFVNNQHFELSANISVDHAPTLLNWSGGTFTNLPLEEWARSTAYTKYDVVYANLSTGEGNKLDNFYYCNENHSSSEATSPTGTSSKWTQEFFFEPDIGVGNQVQIKADVLEYKNSFVQRLKTNNNISTFDLNYTFSDIGDHQLKSMLHFLERKGGYRKFKHQIPSVYNRPKVYFCPEWTHTWNYYNSNTLQVSLIADPLGVIPTGTYNG